MIYNIKTLYEYHKKQYLKYENMLFAAGELINGKESNSIEVYSPATVSNVVKINGKPTGKHGVRFRSFEEFVQSLFSDGRPRNIHQIISAYRDVSNKPIIRKDFASKLSGLKRKHLVETQILRIGSYQAQHIWGLWEWFENKKLTEIYLQTYIIANGLIV